MSVTNISPGVPVDPDNHSGSDKIGTFAGRRVVSVADQHNGLAGLYSLREINLVSRLGRLQQFTLPVTSGL